MTQSLPASDPGGWRPDAGDMRVVAVASATADEEDKRLEFRSKRRTKTFTAGAGEHRQTVVVPPDVIAELHALHESQKQKRVLGQAKELPDSTIMKSWGPQGTWFMHGKMPMHHEIPKHKRATVVWPSCYSTDHIFHSCDVAAITSKGCKHRRDTSVGQDNFSISQLEDGWRVVCVMDGHGPNGHWPATRAAKTLPFFLRGESCAAMLRHGQVKAALLHAFSLVQKDLEDMSARENISLQVSGCTAFCAVSNTLQQPDSVWVAFAGDSRAVLLVPGYGVVQETVDHKPTLPEERKRLEEMGCEIFSKTHPNGFVETRAYIKGERFPGLCMSRSLGDLLVKPCGVIAEPEVVEWRLEGFAGASLLACSDGIWEFMENAEVAETVLGSIGSGKSKMQALDRLLTDARRAWATNEGVYCDDITLVLMTIPASGGVDSSRYDQISTTAIDAKMLGCGDPDSCITCSVS
mmetsp:Transcript_24115/g.53457  ORF Transcript_24115/g.53457 Transcript_24115/m.53457 type:complete len:464 (+) Transcript_24115:117-1508(+)